MSYYRTCPTCGAALDPGERCDCTEKAAPVLQHRDGKAEQIEQPVSASIMNKNKEEVK